MHDSEIYTTEPMATRALAAEIRHDAARFIQLLERRCGVESLGELKRVRCEAVASVDLQLDFENPEAHRVGIEAKVDHEFSKAQFEKQIRAMDRLILLLPIAEHAPSWLPPEVIIVTWEETLGCFSNPRLTLADIQSMPLQKSTMSLRFERLREQVLTQKLDPAWSVEVRNLNGKPACCFESPELLDGRRLQGDIQIHGWGMPDDVLDAQFRFFLGVSVTEAGDFPDPEDPHAPEPGWIGHLRMLQSEVLQGQSDRLLISQTKPRSGTSVPGKHKLGLAKRYLPEHQHLTQGYVPSVLGARSKLVGYDSLDGLATIAAEIMTRWYEAETTK